MLFRSDRKSTRLNSSHLVISYAVFCLKKKNNKDYISYAGAPGASLDRKSLFCGLAPARRDGANVVTALREFRRLDIGLFFFFFNDRAPPEISPLPLHDPLPI